MHFHFDILSSIAQYCDEANYRTLFANIDEIVAKTGQTKEAIQAAIDGGYRLDDCVYKLSKIGLDQFRFN
eukprot:g62296.t1